VYPDPGFEIFADLDSGPDFSQKLVYREKKSLDPPDKKADPDPET